MRVAVIDMGTNSTRLFIADCDRFGAAQEIFRATRITGLGRGVDEDGNLTESAISRTTPVLEEYAQTIRENNVEYKRVAATAAMRDATNSDEVLDLTERILGVRPKIISGEMEAALTFVGVMSDPFIARMAPEHLVVDIGGGSTEISQGLRRPRISKSLNVGCGRLCEDFLASDPPTKAQLDAASAHVAAVLAVEFPLEPTAPETAIAVAGTATTLAAIELEIEPYDPQQTHRFRLTLECVERLTERLAALPTAERKEVVGLEPERADTIVSGALILAAVMRHFGLDSVFVSERDILDGLAITAAADYVQRREENELS